MNHCRTGIQTIYRPRSTAENLSEAPEGSDHTAGLSPGTAGIDFSYLDYARVIRGGTICIPLSPPAAIPPPASPPLSQVASLPADETGPKTNLKIDDPLYRSYFDMEEGLNFELIPAGEIQDLWNQVIRDSVTRSTIETGRSLLNSQQDRKKKLELLLMAALKSGNIDLAVIMLSGLESREANQLAGQLMTRMQDLQKERRSIAEQIGQIKDNSGESAAKLNSLNIKAGDIGTEISILQTFLQDVMAQKKEAQTMASQVLNSRHEAGMAILRNI